MVEATDPGLILSKHKVISALFSYAVHLERGGDEQVVRGTTVITSEKLVWLCIRLNRIVALASLPDVPWGDGLYDKTVVTKWALAASAIPYTKEVGRSVADMLLHTPSIDCIPPHIPDVIWAWLKRQPSPSSQHLGWPGEANGDVVRRVRKLGDIEVFEAYLLLVWSEWNCVESWENDTFEGSERESIGSRGQVFRWRVAGGWRSGLAEMQISIREDFSGVWMGRHRENLINRLVHILEQLDRGLGYLEQHKPDINEGHIQRAKEQYGGLRRVLLEVEEEAVNMFARIARMSHRSLLFSLLTPRLRADSHSTFMCALPLPCP